MADVRIETNTDFQTSVVVIVPVADQATAARYKAALENFIGMMTGELTTTVSGQSVVEAARRNGA